LTSVSPATAQTTAADHAFTPAQTQAIDRIALDAIHDGRTPGLALAVVGDGRVLYERGYGYADLTSHVRFWPDTESYAGPVSMQFTAAAVLLLEQAGKVKLDDKVAKYVPELATVANGVTISQLLLQTSGLPDVSSLSGISVDPTRSIKIDDLLTAIGKAKPADKPGAAYQNNPLNYIVAGVVIERASGETLSDYLQQQIFLPLVMTHTFLAGDHGISPSRATGYARDPYKSGFIAVRPWDPAWMLGARGLVSTVDDLAKWDIEMPILLRVDALRTMFTPANVAGTTQYGMGWVIDRRAGRRYLWYAGSVAGYAAANALLPDDHVAIVVMNNAGSSTGNLGPALSAAVAARVLDVVAPPSATRLDNAILTRAKEWLVRLAEKNIDRTQLTPDFSTFLSDDFVAQEDIAALGKLETIVPISSTTESNGDTLYEFLVRYPHAIYHYRFAVTSNGKIDELELVD
jgi:CubicO group peptidase (beta-lactamase class C family)